MKTQTVRLTSADGHEFGCWESIATNPRGQVVILQEIFGVTDQLKEFASVLADENLSVTIPQLFDRHQPDTVVPFSDADTGRAIMSSLDLNETLSDVEASIKFASRSPQPVFVIGFCWGGGVAFRAAQQFLTSGTVVFYSTKLGDYLEAELLGPALLHFGKTDPLAPPELVEKIG
jgi:carboxymethylenebutenolidase